MSKSTKIIFYLLLFLVTWIINIFFTLGDGTEFGLGAHCLAALVTTIIDYVFVVIIAYIVQNLFNDAEKDTGNSSLVYYSFLTLFFYWIIKFILRSITHLL